MPTTIASRHLGHRSATTASLPARMNEGRTAAQHASVAPVPLSLSARVFRKSRCGSMGGRSTSATPTAAIGFGFISARIAAPPSIGRETAILSAEWPWALSISRLSRRPASRFGRSRCVRGLACRRLWSTTGRLDHRSQFKRNILLARWCGSIANCLIPDTRPLLKFDLTTAMSLQSRSPPINRLRIDCSSCCR